MRLCQLIVFVVDLPPIDEDPAFARYAAGGIVLALHPVPAEVVGPIGARRDSSR